ncbi:MAG: hypothetical protein B6D36_13530 [Planctomycetes bacterium UTPLA1]|jgi:RNA polymerase sigma-70 factor (ECF subfamily)|nr:MAG: hypothetical protein B6D36_13530 [Planctomycetes bacterium UTPLA1]
MHTTDPRLLGQIKQLSNDDDWSAFFDLYAPLVFRVAKVQGLQDDDCEEIVQQVMVAVMRQIAEFEYRPDLGRFRDWLAQMTRHKIADLMKARSRSILAAKASGSVACPDSFDPFEQMWERQWQRALLERSIEQARNQIGPEVFQAFWLRVVDGWNGGDVADFLGISTSAVHVYKHRVVSLVREYYAQIIRRSET